MTYLTWMFSGTFVFLLCADTDCIAQNTYGVSFKLPDCYATRFSEDGKLYDSIWIKYDVELPTDETGSATAKVLDSGSMTYTGELTEDVDNRLSSKITEHWANNPNDIDFDLPVPETYAEIDIDPLRRRTLLLLIFTTQQETGKHLPRQL